MELSTTKHCFFALCSLRGVQLSPKANFSPAGIPNFGLANPKRTLYRVPPNAQLAGLQLILQLPRLPPTPERQEALPKMTLPPNPAWAGGGVRSSMGLTGGKQIDREAAYV